MNDQQRTTALLGVLALIVVLVQVIGIAGADDGRADPSRAGLLDLIDVGIRALPGFGDTLAPDDLVGADCVEGDRIVVAPSGTCVVAVPAGIDRVVLRPTGGVCPLRVVAPGQVTQRLDVGDVRGEERTLRIALAEDGARLVADLGPCVFEIVP